jgi:hypothetical protein
VRPCLGAACGGGVEVGPAGVPDQYAGQDEPRLVAADVVGCEVRVVCARVSWRRDRAHLGVAEPDDLSVGQRAVVELDAGAFRQVAGRLGGRQARVPPAVDLAACDRCGGCLHARRICSPGTVAEKFLTP